MKNISMRYLLRVFLLKLLDLWASTLKFTVRKNNISYPPLPVGLLESVVYQT